VPALAAASNGRHGCHALQVGEPERRGGCEAALLQAFCGSSAARELRLAAPPGELQASLSAPPLEAVGPAVMALQGRRGVSARLAPLRVVKAVERARADGGSACLVSLEWEPAPAGSHLAPPACTVLTLRK
jgi:hypothetical protein